QRWSTARWPRFVVDGLHRNISLLAMAFLVAHILTSVLDSFAPISLIDSVIPFTGAYRPFWLGLGAVAFDLLLAVTATSLLRQRMGFASWRAIHWLTYLSWPIALLHGIGTGSDVKGGVWRTPYGCASSSDFLMDRWTPNGHGAPVPRRRSSPTPRPPAHPQADERLALHDVSRAPATGRAAACSASPTAGRDSRGGGDDARGASRGARAAAASERPRTPAGSRAGGAARR